MRSQFLCDRYQCKISPEACAARQERAHKEAYMSELSLSFEPCFECEQGKKKIKEVNMDELKYPCKKCGDREALVSKKTGRPIEGPADL